MADRIKLIALSANVEMAKSIAKRIKAELLPTKVMHFADGEMLFEAEKSFSR